MRWCPSIIRMCLKTMTWSFARRYGARCIRFTSLPPWHVTWTLHKQRESVASLLEEREVVVLFYPRGRFTSFKVTPEGFPGSQSPGWSEEDSPMWLAALMELTHGCSEAWVGMFSTNMETKRVEIPTGLLDDLCRYRNGWIPFAPGPFL